ncbi:MAG: Lrp/AsnC family transcriptional regulator [Candidatus Hodarchaeales archaeon]
MKSTSRNEIDEIDWKIIETLQNDPTLKYVDIASSIGINKNTVTSRIRKMREMGIVEFPSCVVNPIAAGWSGVGIMMIKTSPTEIEEVAEKLAQFEEITCLGTTMGPFDLAAHVVTPSAEELWDFINNQIKTIKAIEDLQIGTFFRMLKSTYKMKIPWTISSS